MGFGIVFSSLVSKAWRYGNDYLIILGTRCTAGQDKGAPRKDGKHINTKKKCRKHIATCRAGIDDPLYLGSQSWVLARFLSAWSPLLLYRSSCFFVVASFMVHSSPCSYFGLRSPPFVLPRPELAFYVVSMSAIRLSRLFLILESYHSVCFIDHAIYGY